MAAQNDFSALGGWSKTVFFAPTRMDLVLFKYV